MKEVLPQSALTLEESTRGRPERRFRGKLLLARLGWERVDLLDETPNR